MLPFATKAKERGQRGLSKIFRSKSADANANADALSNDSGDRDANLNLLRVKSEVAEHTSGKRRRKWHRANRSTGQLEVDRTSPRGSTPAPDHLSAPKPGMSSAEIAIERYGVKKWQEFEDLAQARFQELRAELQADLSLYTMPSPSSG